MKLLKISCAILIIMLLTIETALGVEVASLKDANHTLSGYICWNITMDDWMEYDYDNHNEQIRVVNLNSGKTLKFSAPGYIISKDPDEYSGVLFANEEDGMLTITHLHRDGTSEIVYEDIAPAPVEHLGRQTICAYMRRNLYFWKALQEPVVYSAVHEKEVIQSVDVQMCRKSQDGAVFEYDLICRKENYNSGAWSNPISGYSIHPDGRIVWVAQSTRRDDDPIELNQIYMQKPDENAEVIVSTENRADIAYDWDSKSEMNWIENAALCWGIDDDVLFLVNKADLDYRLMQYDVKSGTTHMYKTSSGEVIDIDGWIEFGSFMTISPNGKYIAYLTTEAPNIDPQSLVHADNRFVPIVVDLTTGKSYQAYEYENEEENRQFRWRISWHE